MSINCSRCGVQTEIPESFIKERKSFRRQTEHYCPTCWSKRQLATHKGSFLWTLGTGIIGAILVWRAPGLGVGWLLVNLFLLQVFLILTILPHELSHALTARAVGFRVFAVNIGLGQTVWKGKWLGLDLDLRAIPVGGITLVAPRETRGFRRKLFLIVLAGPLVNLLIALLAMELAGYHLWNWLEADQRILPLTMFSYANVWVLIFNLWPRNLTKLLGKTPSDGKQLITIPFFTSDKVEEAHAMWFALEASQCHARGYLDDANLWFEKGLTLYPHNLYLLNGRGLRFIEQTEFEKARNCFCSILDTKSESAPFRAIIMNNIAYADILIGNPDFLDEADRFSQEAMAVLGLMPAIKGTRGAVLTELGRVDEALPLLHDAMQNNESATAKAQNACLIAIAEKRRGNMAEAEKYLTKARELDEKCILIARADADITRH